MRRILRPILLALIALLIYFILLPWLALEFDQRMRIVWRLPFWTETPAAICIIVGLALLLKCGWTWVFHDANTGVLDRWINASLLGSWVGGIGLAILLRSPSFVGVVVLVTVIVLLLITQRRKREAAESSRVLSLPLLRRVPLWTLLLLVIASAGICAADFTVDVPSPAVPTEPAILVQIRCKPGMTYQWKADFNKHIRPAIEEVIAHGGAFTGLQFIESTLPAQPFQFMLIYTGKSFASLDKPSVPPHYAALFQREGTLRGLAVLKEMTSYEEESTVMIIYLSKVK